MKFLVHTVLALGFFSVSRAEIYNYAQQQHEDLAYQQKNHYTVKEQRTYLPPAYEQQSFVTPQETYRKEFYTFGAPEEDFEDAYAAHKISQAVQKNVRVIFIRSPEQKGFEQAALQLASQVSDDKTAIYVLNKQTDIGSIANRLNAFRTQNIQKPEVHFVKYRTPDDAAYAQKLIQQQYEMLRGSTHSSDEGVTPVLDFTTKQQQPTYGSAISIAPAYNTGSTDNNLNQLYSQPVATNIGSYNLQETGYEKETNQEAVNLLNSLKTYQTQSFNSNSVSSSNSESFGTLGVYDNAQELGGATADYGDLDKLRLSGVRLPATTYGVPTTSGLYDVSPRSANNKRTDEIVVSKLNQRANLGGKLVFPGESSKSNSNLPSLRRAT